MYRSPALTELVRSHLAPYGYVELDELTLASGATVTIVSKPRQWGSRYLCALLEPAPAIEDLRGALTLHEELRVGLSARYAKFPYFKEVGTYAIVLCSPALFRAVSGNEGAFHDRTGLHTNVMLGTCLVDRSSGATTATASWGRYYSAKHFTALRAAVSVWLAGQGAPAPPT